MNELKTTERQEESQKSIGVANILMKVILLIILVVLLYLSFATWLGITLPW